MRLTAKTLLFVLSPALVAISPSAASADEVDLPALLKRLGVYAAATTHNDDAVDATCTERSEKLDGDGKVTSWFEVVTKVTHPGGKEVKEVVKATKDGADVTAKTKEKYAEKAKEKKKGDGFEAKSPFEPGEQGKYRFTLKGPAAGDASKLLIQFAPKGKASTELLVGHGLVDPAKGEVLKITARPSEYPSMVSEGSFEWDTPPLAFGPATTRFAFRGEGGILFIKQRFRGTTRCQHVTPPPGATAPAP